MNIGILGSGSVAQTLAAGFAQRGHRVTLGTSNPAKLADWTAKHPAVKVAAFADAAAFGTLLVLAVKGSAAMAVARATGAQALAGKTVIDACNPFADSPPVDGVLPFFTGPNESLMEQLQAEFPAARFVKAFNSVGAGQMIDPPFETRPTMFIAGNDAAAKADVTALLDEVGWDSADMGSAVAARAVEPLAMLWCIRGFLHDRWGHAFKLLDRA